MCMALVNTNIPSPLLHVYFNIYTERYSRVTITSPNSFLSFEPSRCCSKKVKIYYKSFDNKEKKIKSLNETTRGYCAQEELQFRPKLTSSTHKSFNIPVKSESVMPAFLLLFSVWL